MGMRWLLFGSSFSPFFFAQSSNVFSLTYEEYAEIIKYFMIITPWTELFERLTIAGVFFINTTRVMVYYIHCMLLLSLLLFIVRKAVKGLAWVLYYVYVYPLTFKWLQYLPCVCRRKKKIVKERLVSKVDMSKFRHLNEK
jgi:hypothetical protein